MGTLGVIIVGAISAAIGFVAGIFVYRNNTKSISDIADRVDTVHDNVKDITEK